MRGLSISTVVSVALAILSPVVEATAEPFIPHASIARRHMHSHHKRHEIVKRGQCAFPTDAGLVSVTPGEQNAGWAMSPDQPCKTGMYCPYACPPGQLMAQWDPKATTYSYPGSMNGGLYCNKDGEIEKPFPNKPYCYDGTGSFSCNNRAGSPVSICQTVLPGNEAMLIPTLVTSSAVLAVPDTKYWAKTAAHYYINPPGVSPEEACVWGTKDKPIGNWSPYVTGANQLDNGETFVTIGWNPIYIEPDVPFRNVVPDWGVKIECSGGKCGGLPCYIDPAEHGVNEVSQMKGAGAGGAHFCVVSVPKGAKATLVVFSSNGGGDSDTKPSPSPSAKPSPSASPTPSSTSVSPTTTSTPKSTNASKPTSVSKYGSSSSSASSSTSASSEPSSTTSSSSSSSSSSATETDSSSSSTEVDESTPTATVDEDSVETDLPSNVAEFFVINSSTTSSSAPTPTSDTNNQVVGAVTNNNDAAINASPNVEATGPSDSSGAILSFSGNSAIFLSSVLAALVIVL